MTFTLTLSTRLMGHTGKVILDSLEANSWSEARRLAEHVKTSLKERMQAKVMITGLSRNNFPGGNK